MFITVLYLLTFAVNGVTDEKVVQWGTTPQRNAVYNVSSDELPESWNPGQFERRTGKWLGGEKTKNIKWVAPLGGISYSTPIITDDKVFCCTNNKLGLDPQYPASVDLGVMYVFEKETGKFLAQYSSEKLDAAIDWPEQGICSNPAIEGNRLWLVTNRCEVVCLDTESIVTPPKVLWSFNMIEKLGVKPHNMTSCSPLVIGNLVFTNTSNGVGPDDKTVVAPDAPSFIALEKTSGELVWSSSAPGKNILDGQWASPSVYNWKDAKGTENTQVLFPGGDGWLYAFDVKDNYYNRNNNNEDYVITPSWKFDCNPKDSVWKGHGRGDRNIIVSTPVIEGSYIYISTGQDPESGEGPALLWCIDPTKILSELNLSNSSKDAKNKDFIDLSEMLVLDAAGNIAPVRRTEAVDAAAGDKVVPNPGSAVHWKYAGRDSTSKEFEDKFHRTLGNVVVSDGILLIGDFSGVVHCLDAKTGECFWTHDSMSTIWGSPIAAGGRFYIGNTNGDVLIFTISKECDLTDTIGMGDAVYGAVNIDEKTIYIVTNKNIFAIRKQK
ncbi:MAG: PQQ-binding-like beta-propeller repeat protein [Thermoguttaceae bacterium]